MPNTTNEIPDFLKESFMNTIDRETLNEITAPDWGMALDLICESIDLIQEDNNG